MSVLINKKRCDNADACSCIIECPTKAFYWDETKNSIAVNNNLCINCRKCVLACEAGAVKVARNDEEYNRIKTEYDEDMMSIEELFQDRYGAGIVDEKYGLELNELDNIIMDSNKPLLIEFYNLDDSKCLINSIPINEIINYFKIPLVYRKINVDNIDDISKYNVTELPSLLVFNQNNIVYKYNGFISVNDKKELFDDLDKNYEKK